MFDFGYFFGRVLGLIDWGLNIYMWLIIIRALISWVSPDPYSPVVQFLYRTTEPALSLVRRVFPRLLMWSTGMDLSPFLAIMAIWIIRYFLEAIRRGVMG